MSLTLDKCGDDWDWYALHRDGLNLQWASIEGDADEWRQVADAIEKGESVGFRRVGFRRVADGSWLVDSPRNSMHGTPLTADEVSGLVPIIRAAIANHHDENRETER